jgi:hypothetical protein
MRLGTNTMANACESNQLLGPLILVIIHLLVISAAACKAKAVETPRGGGVEVWENASRF